MSCKISTLNSCFLLEENERFINVVFSGVDISADTFIYKITSSYSGKEYASIVPTHDATTVTLAIPDDLVAQVYKHELTWMKDGKTRVVFQGYLTISKDSNDCNCPNSVTFQIVDETINVEVSINESIIQNNYNVKGQGDYVAGTYQAGDVVTYNSSSYLSTIDNNIVAPLDSDGALNPGWQLIAQGIPDDEVINIINAVDIPAYQFGDNISTQATNVSATACYLQLGYSIPAASTAIKFNIKVDVAGSATLVQLRDNGTGAYVEVARTTYTCVAGSNNFDISINVLPGDRFGVFTSTSKLQYSALSTSRYLQASTASPITYTAAQISGTGAGASLAYNIEIAGLNGGVVSQILELKEAVEELQQSAATPSTNYLYQKNIRVGGDSMVYGHSLGPTKTWLAKLAARNSMTADNQGINGNWLTAVVDSTTSTGYKGSGVPLVLRYTDWADDNPDFVLIFIGTNDAANAVPIGTSTDTDTSTFYGALNTLISGLITKYTAAKFGFITPYLRNANYPAYITALVNRCNYYNIQIWRNDLNGGIQWGNTAQMALYNLNGDGYHLTEDGHLRVSYMYEQWIRGL